MLLARHPRQTLTIGMLRFLCVVMGAIRVISGPAPAHDRQLLVYGGTAQHLGQVHFPKELCLLDLGA
jgi:hypothetical protein